MTTTPVETAWLIELPESRNGMPLWWTGGGWTTDSLEAVRFARQCDAEAVIRAVMGAVGRATEHQWG